MKNTILLSMVFSVFMFFSISCSAQKKRKSNVEKAVTATVANSLKKPVAAGKTDSTLVTFIELGSVNCIPCKMMQPIMEEVKKEYAGQVKVIFHDVWTEAGKPEAKKWGIRTIPTQIFLDKKGKEYFRHIGFFPKEELVDVLKKQGVK